MTKDCKKYIKTIKISKKKVSWSKNLEVVKIISPNKNKENENNNLENDYQDILKLKIKHLKQKHLLEEDNDRKQYIQNKINNYILQLNEYNFQSMQETILFLDI
jgi:hypothetical protein